MGAHRPRALLGAVLMLALGGSPPALVGQVAGLPDLAQPPTEVRVVPLRPSVVGGGWLGFRVRVEVTASAARSPGTLQGGPDLAHRVRVEEVLPEGPARAAGMAPGDRILQINGMDGGQALERGILSGVQPGQVVRFGIEREGRRLELRVVAAPRPASATPATTAALARVRTDSIVSHMLHRIDSARTSVAREALVLSVTRQEPPVDRRTLVAVRQGFPADSTLYPGGEVRADRAGATTLQALVSRSGNATASSAGAAPSGPMLVYATGQRVVLGAEVTPVNPGLASYFGVDAGLLVTQVVEGAPGARGGLTPGDVIVRVGSAAVSTVEELRAAAGAGIRSPPLVLGVVREGRRLELRIPR